MDTEVARSIEHDLRNLSSDIDKCNKKRRIDHLKLHIHDYLDDKLLTGRQKIAV